MNLIPPRPEIDYPESDGQPMADNTKQFEWIYVLFGNIAALFRERADVFVCGNQNWYPVEGHPEIVQAPDVYAVFGRPKGHRRSWKQWEEGDVPMTVVFEVLSPKNTVPEMANKLAFYDDYGVEEYYIYDPDNNHLQVYLRKGEVLIRVRRVDGFASPRLGIRFDLSGEEMVVRCPDGSPFLTFEELKAARDLAEQQRDEQQRRADEQQHRADEQQRRADDLMHRIQQAEQRAARLAELTRRALSQQAAPEELEELQRLLQQP